MTARDWSAAGAEAEAPDAATESQGVKIASGWQMIIADLSMILFMVSLAAMHGVPPARPLAATPNSAAMPPRAEPVAVYIADRGAPPLSGWLEGQAHDARERLTITAYYRPEAGAAGRRGALAEAGALADTAGKAGAEARLLVEPGQGPARAVLAFDAAALPVARSLHEQPRAPAPHEDMP